MTQKRDRHTLTEDANQSFLMIVGEKHAIPNDTVITLILEYLNNWLYVCPIVPFVSHYNHSWIAIQQSSGLHPLYLSCTFLLGFSEMRHPGPALKKICKPFKSNKAIFEIMTLLGTSTSFTQNLCKSLFNASFTLGSTTCSITCTWHLNWI